MKILFSSYAFSPSVGGIETVSASLATEFCGGGHEVKLITETAEPDAVSWPFEVTRRPSPMAMLRLLRWCDVVFHNNISLRAAWPLLFFQRPWVIAHHTWIPQPGGSVNIAARLKRSLLRFAANISVSHAIAADIGVPSVIIGNPYRDTVFRIRKEVPRDREFAFLGRLVSDKGADLVIEALANLHREKIMAKLTVIGSGPEESKLRELTVTCGVSDAVNFVGAKYGEDLTRVLNDHQILVVPSRWAEPFGMVALEGIACGCVVVGSEAGGLKDAIGPCGMTFPNGDVRAMIDILRSLVTQPAFRESFTRHAEEHLGQFKPAIVAMKYLAVFQQAIDPG